MSVFSPYTGPNLQFIDANYFFSIVSNQARIQFDLNDLFIFYRSSNELTFFIGGLDIYSSTSAQFKFTAIPILPSYTVATLPSAAANTRGIIYVSDGTTNKRQAVSDGTNWRWPDGAIVS